MKSLLSILVWALATCSCLLCTQAAHTGHSSFEVPKRRGAYRDAQTIDEGDNYYYDLESSKGQGDDLQKDERFADSDMGLNTYPARASEARQQYMAEDSGAPLYKGSPSYEDSEDVLGELVASSLAEDPQKNKRESHSLSIVNPLDVLRQRLMLDLATRKMKQNQEQIKANDRILKTLGKRSLQARTAAKDYSSRQQDSTFNDFNV